MLMMVVGLVLLIACANLANLQLARAAARAHAWSIHRALGASRWQLARPLLLESLLLGLSGAALGLVLAQWAIRLLVSQLSTATNRVFLDLSLDWRVLAFTAALGVLTALLFGTAPALRAAAVTPMTTLRRNGGEGPPSSGSFASGLVVAQVALSLVLVVGAGLFVRTLMALAQVPLGFDRDRVLLVTLSPGTRRLAAGERTAMYEHIRQAVGGLPGVGSAALSIVTPMGSRSGSKRVQVVGSPPVPPLQSDVYLNLISSDWFTTFGTPILAGRDLRDGDQQGGPPVALVNEAFARTFLNGANPIGRLLQEPNGPQEHPAPREIVGLVGNAVYRSIREPMAPTMYFPLDDAQRLSTATVSLSVRSRSASPERLTRSIAAAIDAIDRDVAFAFRPLSNQVETTFARERLVAMLSGYFGALSLLLASLGLYGLTSYAVHRRRAEIGIRVALGAAPAAIVQLILRRVCVLVGVGMIAGTALSAWASPFVASLLWGLEPRDPLTLVGAAGLLATVALTAGLVPALRAAHIEPAKVLRAH